jgi:hypothetical protein
MAHRILIARAGKYAYAASALVTGTWSTARTADSMVGDRIRAGHRVGGDELCLVGISALGVGAANGLLSPVTLPILAYEQFCLAKRK